MLRNDVEVTAVPVDIPADAALPVAGRSADRPEEVVLEHAVEAEKPAATGVERVGPPLDYTDAVLKLLHRLRRKPLFRGLAADPSIVTHLPPDTKNSMIALLRKPDDNRWRECLVACWALGMTEYESEAEKETAVRTLRAVLDNTFAWRPATRREIVGPCLWKRSRNAIGRTALTALGLTAIVVGALVWSDRTSGDSWFYIGDLPVMWLSAYVVFAVLSGFVVAPLSIGIDVARNTRIRIMAAWALRELPTVDSIAALAGASMDGSAKLRQAATESLLVTLPLLSPEQYGQLSTQTVPNLCRAMNAMDNWLLGPAWVDQDVRLRILEALEKIGDGSAIPHVESLARSAGAQAVREAARRLVPILEERKQRDNNAKMLLRAAESSGTPADQLLRAASDDRKEAAPDQLLRPSTGNADAEVERETV